MGKNRKELMAILQRMENRKIKYPILCDENDGEDEKFDLLAMNILIPSIYAVDEINYLLKNYSKNIIVITLPITKYKDEIHHTEVDLTKLEIEEQIKNGNRVMIYSTVSEIKFIDEIKYRVKILKNE